MVSHKRDHCMFVSLDNVSLLHVEFKCGQINCFELLGVEEF